MVSCSTGESTETIIPPPLLPTSPTPPGASISVDVLSLAPNLIAECLTKTEQGLFLKIHPSMCLDSDLLATSPPVQDIINRFNNVSYWVAHEIVTTPNLKKRISLVKHYISVAEHCKLIGNFNTLLEIIAGLNMSPVQRLKRTWLKLHRSKKTFDSLEALMDSNHNYSAYRQALAETQTPCLPYVGVFFRDFTFIDVGNSSFVRPNFVNICKLKMMSGVAREMERYQSIEYRFEEERLPTLNHWSNILGEVIQNVGSNTTSDQLYHFSKLCEGTTADI
jgi:son of sevenless-like protein